MTEEQNQPEPTPPAAPELSPAPPVQPPPPPPEAADKPIKKPGGKKRKKKRFLPAAALPAGQAGRPTLKTPEIAQEICTRLSLGQSLMAICELAHMPARATVLNWVVSDPEFQTLYARAREAQAHTYLDEILEIADNAKADMLTDEEGGLVPNTVAVRRADLRIKSRQWLVCRQAPKTFPDTTTSVRVGGDDTNPEAIKLLVETIVDSADERTLRQIAAGGIIPHAAAGPEAAGGDVPA